MAKNIPFTGERFLPWMNAPQIAYEHWHRYLYALSFVQDRTVLDVACGEGYGSFFLSRNARKVVGVDVDREIVRHASEKYVPQSPDKLSFVVGTCNRIPIDVNESFDVIVSFETLEHLTETDQTEFLKEVKRLIKPTGLFIISTPDKLNYSDVPKTSNEFHQKELYVKEFEALLAGHFARYELMYQSVVVGSYLWQPSDPAKALHIHGIDLSESGFVPADKDMDPTYVIALCSDGPLPESPDSLLADPGKALLKEKEDQLQAMVGSRSWRVTEPLRKIAALVRQLSQSSPRSEANGPAVNTEAAPDSSFSGVRRTMKGYRHVLRQWVARRSIRIERLARKVSGVCSLALKNPVRVAKGAVFFARNGLSATMNRTRQVVSSEAILQLTSPMVDKSDSTTIYILTTPHGTFIARLLARCLNRVGRSAQIIYGKPKNGFAPGLHFVLCAQMFDELPLHYVAFQLEQSINPRWFGKSYFDKLHDAYAIFDYSLTNIRYLQSQGLNGRQIFYVPMSCLPGCDQDSDENEEPAYDVLFYGDVNDRRRRFLKAIARRYRINVLTEVYGETLYAQLKNAKLVVNLHYYPDALLETPRIYECLSHGCLVVSEMSADFEDHRALECIVDFFAYDDVDDLLDKIDYWLSDEDRRVKKIQSNRRALLELPDWFEYYFLRFLLSSDDISFETFYDLAGPHIRFEGNRICLGVPEAVERRLAFVNHNPINFQYFPGLVHSLPWVGCGLSYKFIMRKAQEHGFEQLIVCEDDVEFPDGWQKRFGDIQSYLSAQPADWDVFAGLIAQLNEGARVDKVATYGDTKFVHMDKMVSMVFNIYNRSFFHRIATWDDRNRVVDLNTIDRYIESMPDLRVVTTFPFLVGHKEELVSTLWHRSNRHYTDMITKSSALLETKILERESSV